MDTIIKKSNILIIYGVYPKDFITHEIFVDEKTHKPDILYTEIPKKFINVANWPTVSNLKCWGCDQIPISYPKFIPVNPEQDGNGYETCDVVGNFCEWNCVVKYVESEFPKEQQWDTLKLISRFESKFTGKYREIIMPCPPKTLMQQYCGKAGLTAKQWRDKLMFIDSSYSLSAYKTETLRDLN